MWGGIKLILKHDTLRHGVHKFLPILEGEAKAGEMKNIWCLKEVENVLWVKKKKKSLFWASRYKQLKC